MLLLGANPYVFFIVIALVILNLVRSRFLQTSLNFRLTIILVFSRRYTLLFLLAFLTIGTRESHQCDFLANGNVIHCLEAVFG